jgi:hypothetical protein
MEQITVNIRHGCGCGGCWSVVLWLLIIGLLAEAWEGGGLLLRSVEVVVLLIVVGLAIALWASKRPVVK